MRFAPFILLPLVACASPNSAELSEPSQLNEAAWAVAGTWTDACCCKVACPCLFGTPPTEGFCEGASLFEIESGHHDGVSLDGLSAIATYRVKGWTRVVVDDAASAEQVAAFAAVLPHMLPFVKKGSPPTVENGSLDVIWDGDSVRYSTADTTVELALVESANGEPIILQNLPAKGTPFPKSHDHTQYISRRLFHDSDAGAFEWSERNGFSSKLDLSSEDA